MRKGRGRSPGLFSLALTGCRGLRYHARMRCKETRVRQAEPDDAHAIAQIRARVWCETYRGLMPDHVLHSLDPQRDGERMGRLLEAPPLHSASFVLTSAGVVVGFGRCGPPRGDVGGAAGEIYAINISAGPAKRSGGGAALMHAMALALDQNGLPSVGLWVIKRNDPAVSFYAALVGLIAGERPSAEDGTLTELLFVWRDVHHLTEKSRALASRKGWRLD